MICERLHPGTSTCLGTAGRSDRAACTPSCAAKSRQDGRRAPGTNSPLAMASVIPLRICSTKVILTERSIVNGRSLALR